MTAFEILQKHHDYIQKNGEKQSEYQKDKILAAMEEYAKFKEHDFAKALTKQKLWDMAKVITDKQKAAKEQPTDKVDWNMLKEMWFDWLEEQLFGNDA